MNKAKQQALKIQRDIEKLLNIKFTGEIHLDNDKIKSHCKDNQCKYVKNNCRQPCICSDYKIIRLVEIKNGTQIYTNRIYYQLGHEMGHYWFGITNDSKRNETLACYTALLCLHLLLKDEIYEYQCLNEINDYSKYNQLAYKIIKNLNYSIDKNKIEQEYQKIEK